MKFHAAILASLLWVPAAAALVPEIHMPDGITALVSSVGTTTDAVVARDAEGNFAFDISIFERAGESWAQAGGYATLRIAVYDAAGEHDVFSKGAPMKADAPVRIVAPGHIAQTGQPMDVWVTIYKVTSYPTSHLSVQKNALIAAGELDAADVFDYHHGANPIAG